MKNFFMNLWNKRENRIFLMFIVSIILVFIYSILMLKILNVDFKMSDLDGTGVADGYIVLAEIFVNLFKLFGVALSFLLPLLTNFVSFVFALIARLFCIGKEKNWKDIVSKVFNVLAVVPLIIVGCIIMFIIKVSIFINWIMFILSLIIFVIQIGIIVYIFKEVFAKKENNLIDNKA